MLKSIFEGIAFLFEEVLFLPFNFFRDLELESWFGANILNWGFMFSFDQMLAHCVQDIKHKKSH